MNKINLIQQGMAGTAESSDIQITITAAEGDFVEIELNSSVEKQFGNTIKKVISDTLEKLGIEGAKVVAVDQGALDCTIVARTLAAVYRAAGIEENYNWEEISKWND